MNKKILELNGRAFTVYPMPAWEALKLKRKLASILLPAIGGVIGKVKGSGISTLGDLSLDGLEGGIETLMESLDENTFLSLTKKILNGVQVRLPGENGKAEKVFTFVEDGNFETIFNVAFGQHIMDLYKIMWAVLQVNFPDLLSAVGGIGTQFQTLMSGNPTGNGAN